MKILYVTNFFPPTHEAGTEVRTLAYARSFHRRGHKVQVVCATDWGEGDHYWNGQVDEPYEKVPVRRLRINWALADDPNRFLYDNPVVEKYLRAWLPEVKPDVIHVTSCYTLSASVIRAVKQQELPVIITLTDFWFICPRLNLIRGDGSLCDGRATAWDCLQCNLWNAKLYRWPSRLVPDSLLARPLLWICQQPWLTKHCGLRGLALDMKQRKALLNQALGQADRVIASTNCVREMFINSGISAPIHIVYRGQDLGWLDDYRGKVPSKLIRFGYIGKIDSQKGAHTLIEAFRKADFDGQARLSIHGSLTENPAYVKHLQTLAGDRINIHFNGLFPHERLAEILAQIDVLVVPSLWYENNPHVVQEAFAAQTPVIATNLGTMKEFIQHEVNGLLFKRGNADDLALQLRRVANQPELLEHLRVGIPPVKHIEDEVDELEEIYRELIGQK